MALESNRELIMVNIKETLEGINGSGDYNHKINLVTRDHKVVPEQESEANFPLIQVFESEESIDTKGVRITRELDVNIIGWFHEAKEQETVIQTKLNRVAKDIETALMASKRRGQTFVDDTRLDHIERPIVDQNGFGSIKVVVTITYEELDAVDGGHP